MNSPFPRDLGDVATVIVASTLHTAVETCFALKKREKSYSRVMRILDHHRRILRGVA